MTTAAIVVMLAAGLNIVVGYCGLLDSATWPSSRSARIPAASRQGFDLPLLSTIPASSWSRLAGIIIGAPTLRLRSDYLAIVTLGFGEITRITANNLSVTGGPSGIFGVPGLLKIGDIDLQQPAIFYYVTDPGRLGCSCSPPPGCGSSRLGRAWRSCARTRMPPRRWASTPTR